MNYKILSALLILTATPVWAQGDQRMTESFEAPVGGLPADWTVKMRGEGEALIAEVPETSGRNGLLIRRSEAKPGNATVFFTGALGTLPAGNLKDFSGAVNFRYLQIQKAELSNRGVVIRATRPEYDNFGGYYLCVEPRGDKRALVIYYNPKSHLEHGEPLAETPLPSNLAILREYQLRFQAKGSVIRGELCAMDQTGNPDKTIAVVEIENAAENPGYFGLRGGYGNKKADTWFYSLHLEAL